MISIMQSVVQNATDSYTLKWRWGHFV